MKDEERYCPRCGRDVLSWDVACPGCGQVPWDTPEGRRVLRRRRFWVGVSDHGPALFVGALVLLAMLMLLIRARVFG